MASYRQIPYYWTATSAAEESHTWQCTLPMIYRVSNDSTLSTWCGRTLNTQSTDLFRTVLEIEQDLMHEVADSVIAQLQMDYKRDLHLWFSTDLYTGRYGLSRSVVNEACIVFSHPFQRHAKEHRAIPG